MAGYFTNKDGEKFAYDYFFKTGGDVVVISSDKVAFSVSSETLKNASSVFRAMFETCTPADNSIKLDHIHKYLIVYLAALSLLLDDIYGYNFKRMTAGLELCDRFETVPYKSKIVYSIYHFARLEADQSANLFVVAATLQNQALAAKILVKHGPRHALQNSFWHFESGPWSQNFMKDLPGDWVWAYTQAHIKTKHKHAEDRDAYWVEVAGRFIKNLD